MKDEIINKIVSYGVNWFIGIFGSVVQYMYGITKWQTFSFSMFFAQALIGWFVTIVTNEFIPNDWDIRIWLLFVCWFLSTKILDFFDKKWLDILVKKFIDRDHKEDKEDKNEKKTEEI